jgi:hypothetical protein
MIYVNKEHFETQIVDVTKIIQSYNPTGSNPDEIKANGEKYLNDIKKISDTNISIIQQNKKKEIDDISNNSKNLINEQNNKINNLSQERVNTINSINANKDNEISKNNENRDLEIQKLNDQINKEIAEKKAEANAIKLKATEDLKIANENLDKAIKDIEKLKLDKENAIKDASNQELLLRTSYDKQMLDLSLNVDLSKNIAMEDSKKISNNQFIDLSNNASLILRDIQNQTIEDFYDIGGTISGGISDGIKGASDLGIPIPKKSYVPETYAKDTYGRGLGQIAFNIRLRPYKPGFSASKF